MRRAFAIGAIFTLFACSGQPAANGSTKSPPPSPPTATPVPKAASTSPKLAAVLATWDPEGKTPVTISLVGLDGRLEATTTAQPQGRMLCSPPAGAIRPVPLATSLTRTRLYFLDGDSVRFLQPDGITGIATHIPVGDQRSSVFAVSPDDRRIAVSVIDFGHTGAMNLYVEDLAGGGGHVEIYSSQDHVVWPIGWHGGNLITAVVSPCTQGGGPFTSSPLEIHVVDPATGTRLGTIGTWPSQDPNVLCTTPVPPTPAGAICLGSAGIKVLDWNGAATASLNLPGTFVDALAESPRGRYVALAGTDLNGNDLGVSVRDAANHEVYTEKSAGQWTPRFGFIDDDHLIIGDLGPQSRPHVVTISARISVPVAANGIFVGVLPGGLDT
jgi:hypothetical protein